MYGIVPYLYRLSLGHVTILSPSSFPLRLQRSCPHDVHLPASLQPHYDSLTKSYTISTLNSYHLLFRTKTLLACLLFSSMASKTQRCAASHSPSNFFLSACISFPSLSPLVHSPCPWITISESLPSAHSPLTPTLHSPKERVSLLRHSRSSV